MLRTPILLLATLMASMLSVTACGDDGATPTPVMDTGPPMDDVAFDELAPTDGCATSPRCRSFQVQSGCVCVTRPLDDAEFAANRTGCAELNASGETLRTPEDDY